LAAFCQKKAAPYDHWRVYTHARNALIGDG
jgi:hypothetical protein